VIATKVRVGLLLLTACALGGATALVLDVVADEPEPPVWTGRYYDGGDFICRGCQGQYDDLRIGVGIAEPGWCGLWLYVRDHPELDDVFYVHVGGTIEIAHHLIVVDEARTGGVSLRYFELERHR
jgi:hypothetical protein